MPSSKGSTATRNPESPSATTPLAIEATDLVKTYATGRGKPPVQALDGLSLTVRQGEVFGLLGPNGAGKSTTVKILSTLALPDSGRAVVAGHDVARDRNAVRRSIGLISQKSSSAPMMTGRESVVLAARIHGMPAKEARSRAEELLERFALTEAADRLTKTYSGGMLRKLDVAVGLVGRPTVLFLDEPTTGLDPEARAQMWDEIARLASVETADRPADDALSRRGGPPRRPAGHRRPRPGGRRGNAGRAEEPAPGRQCGRRGRRPDDGFHCRRTPFAHRRPRRRHPRGPHGAGSRRRGRPTDPERARHVGAGRRHRRLRHGRPPEPRRRLPPLRRTHLRERMERQR